MRVVIVLFSTLLVLVCAQGEPLEKDHEFSSPTELSLAVSSSSIQTRETIDVFGQLTSANEPSLGELSIEIIINAPDNSTSSIFTTTDYDGSYAVFELGGFTQQGSYTLQAKFAGTTFLQATLSNTENVSVAGDFELLLPDSGADVFTTAVFQWQALANASTPQFPPLFDTRHHSENTYNLIIAEDADFEFVFSRVEGLTGLSTVVEELDPGATYYWLVEVFDGDNQFAGQSAISFFTTNLGQFLGGVISGLIQSNANSALIQGATMHSTLQVLADQSILVSNASGNYSIVTQSPGSTRVCAQANDYFIASSETITLQAGEIRENVDLRINPGSPLAASGGMINMSTNTSAPIDGIKAGFIVSGNTPRRFIIYGEDSGGLIDPELEITDLAQTRVFASNDDWLDHAALDEISALRPAIKDTDAALVVTLSAGQSYLAILRDKLGRPGNGNVQINDQPGIQGDFNQGRLFNMSTNTSAPADGIKAGFIVSGNTPRRFIIYGEDSGGLIDPELIVTDLSETIVYGSNNNWLEHDTACEVLTLRQPFKSSDAALAITLEPERSYIAILRDRFGRPGNGNVQINDVTP